MMLKLQYHGLVKEELNVLQRIYLMSSLIILSEWVGYSNWFSVKWVEMVLHT